MSYETKVKKLQKSEVELEISLPADFLNSARKKAVENLGNSMEIAGFRKGHIPEKIVLEKAGENMILEEAADILLKEHFPKIVTQEKLDIIGRPNISITKLALGNPVEFKAVFAVIPEFKLPDYKKISKEILDKEAKKEEKTEATNKEVDDVLLQIRKNKAHFDWHEAHKNEKGHNHPEIKDEDLPLLDDELAKAAGNFKNLDELKEKVKQNIVTEKNARKTEKTRAEIMEGLVKNTEIDLPEILVENEIEKSLAQMKNDIERAGMKWNEYLAQVKKTDLSAEALAKAEEDLRKDLRKSSENKAKIQLIFNKIAEAEKLEPNKEILENEVKEVMKHYPEAAEINARVYVATILLNSEVLKLLENQN
jgi:trigger factor